jgi:hypothetical protein
MAEPFFGRGGAIPIARMDMQAATAPGRAYAQGLNKLGESIGGAIEKYQLNKEKRAKLEGEIEAMLPTYMQDLTMSGNEDSDKKNMSRLEKFQKGDMSMSDLQGLAGELAMRDRQATKGLDQRYKEAQIQGLEFENRFKKANEENRLLRSTLETEGAGLLNKLRKSQVAVADIEKQLKADELGVNKERLQTELEQAKASLDRTKEEVIAKRNTNSVFAELHQNKLTEFALNVSQARSALAINAEKLDQLRASSDVDLKTKEAELKILEADRKKLEQELSRQQQLMNAFSTSESSEEIDFILPIDIDDAFQKDAAGLFYNIVGGIGSLFGADITPETTSQAQNLRMLETVLLPALTSDISSRPSNFTLEIARGKIPLPNDRDDIGQRKIEQLIPDLKLRLKEAEGTIKSGKTNTNYFQEAVNQASRIRSIIPILENSLKAKNDDQNSSITGKTSTNVGFRILK